MEEKRLALDCGLALLDVRANELGEALVGFGWIWDEVKGSLASGSGSEVNLDQVRALGQGDRHEGEIEKHAGRVYFVNKIRVSDYPSGFWCPRISVLDVDFYPNRSSGRVRVLGLGFGFGCPDTQSEPNPTHCHP